MSRGCDDCVTEAGPTGERYTMREKMFAIGGDFWIETERGERAFR